MKKNVHSLLLSRLSVFILIICSTSFFSSAQDCVDYDIASYPKNIGGTSYAWNGTAWNFTNLKQTKKSGLDIGGTGFFNGLLEYLPPSYSLPANSSKNYPVIIFFHGYASRGFGSSAELCRLFKDKGSDLATHLSIPGRVERQTSNFAPTVTGTTHEFIVISPQFNQYTRLVSGTPDHFPSFNEVEDVIDYVEANYRIDPRRIYLTGLSNGANMITEYAASSLERAKRVAAIMPVALCSQVDHVNNTSRGIDATYIGQAKLKTWFVYCEIDGCGATGTVAETDMDVPQGWVNAIKAVPGNEPPRYTILRNLNPATLYNCSDTLLHDAWSRAYDPNFTASFNYVNGDPSTGTNDGVNQNIYEWFAQQQNVILPVKLKEFTARLHNNKVELKWITTDEKDNASFTVERAGDDQRFSGITTIPGAVDNIGEKEYSFTDASPLSGLSYYRLVQTDLDGTKTYFDIRKILNQQGRSNTVVVSPNPFVSDVSAFLSIDRSQKVIVTVADMNGRTFKSFSGVFSAGSSEIKFGASELPKGVYLVKVSGETFNVLKKVIKN
jgi:predicted esterase